MGIVLSREPMVYNEMNFCSTKYKRLPDFSVRFRVFSVAYESSIPVPLTTKNLIITQSGQDPR